MTGATVNILLVEDNEVDVEAIIRAFRRNRVANPVTVARDGLEALEMLQQERVPTPYLVLLDLNMPRMNGIEFLQEVRKDPSLKPAIVFVLTTSKSEEDKVASYNLNVAGYMVKSEVGADFLRLVDMLDHYWRVIEFPAEKS